MLYLPSGHPRGHFGGVLSDTGGEWMFVSISTEQSSSVQYLHMTMDSFNFPLSKVVDGPKKTAPCCPVSALPLFDTGA